MGYEVLDAGGQTAREPAGAVPAPREVVDLGSGDPPPDEPPSGRRDRRRLPGGMPVLVLAALVVGALLGAAVSRHSAQQRADAADRATLTVAAQATSVSPFVLPIGMGAQLQVTVTNLGPLPVDVEASDRTRSDTDQGTREAVVSVLGARTSIGPGTSAAVEMRVPVDCRPGRVISTSVPVRTADGVHHDVPVALPDDGHPPASICPPLNGVPELRATLVGTVVLPMLELANNTDDPMRVDLPPQALVPDGDSSLMEVVTRPRLPTTIQPHDRLTVHLRFVAHGCVRDLQDLQRLDVATLTVAPTRLRPGKPLRSDDVAVDVTAVVAAAMVRNCG